MNPKLSILERAAAPTSKFFRPLMYAGAVAAAIAGGLTVFQDQLTAAGMAVPAVVLSISKVVGWVGAAVAAVSGLTVDFDEWKKR